MKKKELIYGIIVTLFVVLGICSNAYAKNNYEKKKNDKQSMIEVDASSEEIIGKNTLRFLYKQKQDLMIIGRGYSILIKGKEITNYENELLTDIHLKSYDSNIKFTINRGRYLCGNVYISLKQFCGKYLYIWDEKKGEYEFINEKNMNQIQITRAGEYMITNEKIEKKNKTNRYIIPGMIVTSILMSIVYIAVRRRYWFW